MPRKPKPSIEIRPQRFTWKTVATFDQHAEALADKDQRERAGQRVKVKLRGDRFKIRVGTAVKKTTPAAELSE